MNFLKTTNDVHQLIDDKNKYFKYVLIISFLLVTAIMAFVFYGLRFKSALQRCEERMKKLVKKLSITKEDGFNLKAEDLKEVVQLAVSNNPGFLLKFNECEPEFSKKLITMAPDLVATEIEFCALLRLNFETKEIARYTKSSVRSVEGKKYRIRKKLNILSDQDINIWMAHL
jgi:DNA-binding CsgD family transcriptional regulator